MKRGTIVKCEYCDALGEFVHEEVGIIFDCDSGNLEAMSLCEKKRVDAVVALAC